MIVTILFAGVIIVGVIISMGNNNNDVEANRDTPSQSTTVTESMVNIPLSSISSKATFYSYDSNGVDISYFAVKGSNGDIHVAIDACDVCYNEKKGYEQSDEVMVCRNCGLTFPIEDIGDKNTVGGCWPSFIPITIEGDSVIIEKSDLDNKRYMFE